MLICHMLVGPPSSGKTTFARHFQELLPAAIIVSTDAIRAERFGNEAIQGAWSEVEAVVIQRIRAAVQAGQPVIYDATNVRRSWRMEFLQKLELPEVQWVAWVLKTPLAIALAWNRQRDRQLPETVIQDYYLNLQQFGVDIAEGFFTVLEIDPSKVIDLKTAIQQECKKIQQSHRNYINRYRNFERHGYSRLLDFDRLMHLISLLSRNPGLGMLHAQDPLQLIQLLQVEDLPNDLEPIEEITAVMKAQQGWIYADPEALLKDLAWLEANGFLGKAISTQALDLPPLEGEPNFLNHTYSDRNAFKRLMGTIRYIIQHPLSQEPLVQEFKATEAEKVARPTQKEEKHRTTLRQLNILAQQLQESEIVTGDPLPMLRKDIERILNPYRIFPDHKLRKGYYLGTGILNRSELLWLYQIAAKHCQGLNDVLAKAMLQRLENRLNWAQIDPGKQDSVRSISRSNVVNPDLLSRELLICEAQATALEIDIRQGNLIQICRRKGAASYGDRPQEEEVWPLQILFHNIAWYLGYQVANGPRAGLFCFERLDRLFRGWNSTGATVKRSAQALEQLEQLCQHSFGIYFGTDVNQQQRFLTARNRERQQMMPILDLRFTAKMFSFVSEGTQRFPLAQIQMSQPQDRDLHHLEPDLRAKLYGLKLDPEFPSHPYQMQIKLPPWSFEDVTLKAWILGMGPAVKVLGPANFQHWVTDELVGAAALYSSQFESFKSEVRLI